MVGGGPLCGSEGQLHDAGGRTRGDTKKFCDRNDVALAVFVSDMQIPTT